jgi:uncharacterized protein
MMRNHFRYVVYLFVAMCFSHAHAGAYEDFFKGVKLDLADTVTELLQRGFDPNTADEDGSVALLLALKNESPKVFGVLMAHPSVKVDTPNVHGETPLMMAALRGSLPACQRLIERGAQINRSGWTPLHYAATGPAPETVKLLLARGAAVDSLSPNGTTPLMMAARYGHEDAVFALLAHKADPKLRNERDMTAADFARSAGRDKLATQIDQSSR